MDEGPPKKCGQFCNEIIYRRTGYAEISYADIRKADMIIG